MTTKLILCLIASILVYLWDKVPQWKEREERKMFKEVERWYYYVKCMFLFPGHRALVRYDPRHVEAGYITFHHEEDKFVILTPFGRIEYKKEPTLHSIETEQN